MILNLRDFIGETTAYDKKEAVELSRPKSWLKSVNAFANGQGGVLLFGLKEDNTVQGIDDIKNVSEKVRELIKTRLDPIPEFELQIAEIAEKDILLLRISKGCEPPYFYVGDGGHYAFVRIGNESVPADSVSLKRLSIHGMQTTFDSLFTGEKRANYDFSTLQKIYRQQTDKTLEDRDFLSFGLANRQDNLCNAALLLADNPPFRQSRIFCTRWNGMDEAGGSVDALDDGEYAGSVLLDVPSARRNPLLVDVFSRLNLMERKGSGFEKVLFAYETQYHFQAVRKPSYCSEAAWFKAVLPNLNYGRFRNESTTERPEELTPETGLKTGLKILTLMRTNPEITIQELTAQLGKSRSTVTEQIKRLKANSQVRRIVLPKADTGRSL